MKAQTTENDSQEKIERTGKVEGDTTALATSVRDDAITPGDDTAGGVDGRATAAEADRATNIHGATGPSAEIAEEVLTTSAIAPKPTSSAERKPGLLARLAAAISGIGLDDRAGRALLSILLAFLLWFYVVNLENPSQTTVFNNLTVDVRGLGTGLKLVNSVPPIDVKVQAPQNALAALRPADVHPYIDLTGISAGVRTVPIRADVRNAQEGGMSISLNPGTAQVQLEIEATREFPVQVQVMGTPAFGYGFDAAQADPRLVRVTGAEDLVARVSKVVANVDIEEKAGTQRGARPPVALDEKGKEVAGLTFEPAQIQVVVPIKLLLNYKVVGVRADTRGQPAPGYRVSAITTDPNTVTICCTPSVLNNVQFLDTAPVSISGATFNVITRTELVLPPDVELYPGQSKTISVTVNVEALVTTLQVSVAPIVEGQSVGIGVVVSPDRLDLTLAGTFDQLQGLKPTDVRAFIDVRGKGPGTYEIRPQVVVPQGVKLERALPESVTVTLLSPTPVPPAPTPTGTPTSEATPQFSPTPGPTSTPSP